ncbi:MAG: phosphatase PAP2 family protein [Verrucomicrobiales bacterium]
MLDRPRPSLFLTLLPALVVLALGTIFFRLVPADILWMNSLREDSAWPHGDDFPWSALYHLGTYPALFAVLGALVVLLLGFRVAQWARFRRHSIYLVLAMAVGPGLVTNAILKDHWGRPRPRDVEPLGGLHAYEPLLTFDPSSPGKSFPCGHATMGYFFFALWFFWRRSHPRLAWASLALAAFYGTAIGWARVVQGGHFPSDVLWAAGVLWITFAMLAHWLRVDGVPPLNPEFRPLSWPKLSAIFLLVPALIFLVLLATPMDRKEVHQPQAKPTAPVDLRLQLPVGETTIVPGEQWKIESRSHGFGLPSSGLKSVWKEETGTDGGTRLELKQRLSGLNTEINQTLKARFAGSEMRLLRLTQGEGIVRLYLPTSPPAHGPRRWIIDSERADVEIHPGPLPYQIEENGGKSGPDDAPDQIEVKGAAKVKVLPPAGDAAP